MQNIENVKIQLFLNVSQKTGYRLPLWIEQSTLYMEGYLKLCLIPFKFTLITHFFFFLHTVGFITT